MTYVWKYFASAALAAMLTLPGAAHALSFSGNWNIDTINDSDPGLVVKTSASSGSFTTGDLAVGDSYTFSLFKIWTDETDVGNDDRASSPIKVGFGFSDPVTAGGASGSTTGVNALLTQWGAVSWDGPITLAFGKGDTGRLTLALSDAIFNKGLFGLNEGYKYGANISATLTYDAAPVPLPATLPLLLGGIALVGAAARRRSRAA